MTEMKKEDSMRRPLKMAIRFAAIIVGLTLIPMALGPSDRDRSPYLSALSDLGGASASLAQTTCEYKKCKKRGHVGCQSAIQPYNCVATGGGGCTIQAC